MLKPNEIPSHLTRLEQKIQNTQKRQKEEKLPRWNSKFFRRYFQELLCQNFEML